MSAVTERNWVSRVEEAVLLQLSDTLFLGSRAKALRYAKNHDLKPIAILPAEMWRTICKHFGLYSFEFINELKAQACMPFRGLLELFGKGILIKSSIFLGVTMGTIFSLSVSKSIPNIIVFLGVFLASLFIFMCGAVRLTVLLMVFVIKHAPFFCSKDYILKKLWPNMSTSNLVGRTMTVPVSFGTSVFFEELRRKIINKSRTRSYWIAALPEAIELSKRTVGQEIYKACPVLWIEYNDCAIILAQCGDFSREAEAVEFAKMLAQGRFGNEN